MYKRTLVSIAILICLIISAGCSSNSKVDSSMEKVFTEDLDKHFAGYEGSFVLFDKNKNEYTIYNQEKSNKQTSPCSSFKIYNSLIGLESKVLEDENTTFKWDGTRYAIESWNKDQTLRSAVANSVVWYFQQLTPKVGEEKMQAFLNKIDYGNNDISGGITKFWLQSSLKISPKEQVDTLKKFYDYQLPFSKRNIDIVKSIILLSDEKGARLSGKTGSGAKPGNNSHEPKCINGWFVGYVEKDNNVYYFATNIEGNESTEKSAGGAEAKAITLEVLKDKGLM